MNQKSSIVQILKSVQQVLTADSVLLEPERLGTGEPSTLWIEAVSTGQTILGLRDWIDCHAAQGST